MQSKRRSFYESLAMTFMGMAYAVPLNYVFINKVSYRNAWEQAFWITVIFTIISIGFKYVIRRCFNRLDHKRPEVNPYTICTECGIHWNLEGCKRLYCPNR